MNFTSLVGIDIQLTVTRGVLFANVGKGIF